MGARKLGSALTVALGVGSLATQTLAQDLQLSSQNTPDTQRVSTASETADPAPPYGSSDLVSTAVLTPSSSTTAQHTDDSWSRRTAQTAFAAPLIASQDTCMGSRSFGAQGVGFGFTIGTTWRDATCRRLKNADALDALGYHDAAIDLLCMDAEVRRAMMQAGTPCNARPLVLPATQTAQHIDAAPPPAFGDYHVLFAFDSAHLRPEADTILQPLLATLRADPDLAVDVVGHTDWVGSDAYNLRLSQRRAEAVVDWLVAHGVARERLTATGKGEREPIATNHTAEGRAQNRRVEIHRRDAL